MASKEDVVTTGIKFLENIVITYPFFVKFMLMGCAFVGVYWVYSGLRQLREAASAGIGIGSNERELGKKGKANIIFGMVFINILWFILILTNTLGFVADSTVSDPTDYMNGDIYESANGTADIIMYLIWTVNVLGFYWFIQANFILRGSQIDPHRYNAKHGIMLLIKSIIALNFKFIAQSVAYMLQADFLLKWLGS